MPTLIIFLLVIVFFHTSEVCTERSLLGIASMSTVGSTVVLPAPAGLDLYVSRTM